MKCKKCGGNLTKVSGMKSGFGTKSEEDYMKCVVCGQKHDLNGNPVTNSVSGGFGTPKCNNAKPQQEIQQGDYFPGQDQWTTPD